jgi:Flp pilus assembly protein TadG
LILGATVNFSRASNACRNAAVALKRLRDDKSGAVMLEFAFVVIPFIALILASLYTSLIYFSTQALETAVQTSARTMITGNAQLGGMSQSAFKAQVCTKIPSYMQCSKLYVDVRRSTSFASLNMSAPSVTVDANGNVTNSGAYETIGKSEMGMVRFAYVWEAGSGPLGLDLSTMSNGKRLLVATSVFRAEPYG